MGCIRIGTAGWAIPRFHAEAFPTEGTGLQRYAGRFDAAEINTTFYRPHRASTYARWVETTPAGFSFAVKVPKAITHEARLLDCGERLAAFLAEAALLGDRLGPLLVQLPPSAALDAEVAAAFFEDFRARYSGPVVCEPRHATWFEPQADALLERFEVARAAADPARHPGAAEPGGWGGLAYWRMHGSPRMYYSAYEDEALRTLAEAIAASPAPERWCIFDNTTSGAAAGDALNLRALLSRES